jgi:hypothetical protein
MPLERHMVSHKPHVRGNIETQAWKGAHAWCSKYAADLTGIYMITPSVLLMRCSTVWAT